MEAVAGGAAHRLVSARLHRAGRQTLPNRDFGCHAVQRAELEEPRQLRVSLQRVPESNVLILGRILSFKMEKKIFSKYEAGLWMMRNLPPEFAELIENTMKIRYEGKTCTLPEKELEKLRLDLIEKIKK